MASSTPKTWLAALTIVAGLALDGCQKGSEKKSTKPAVSSARADLRGPAGSRLQGTVSFVEEGGKVRVITRVSGLSPGMHGFHIHNSGVCEAPEFKSAGDHFNPQHQHHGAPQTQTSHAGDLGNLQAGADGIASSTITLSSDRVSLEPGPHSVRNRAVVIHEKPDDLKTQPAGASGARVACGVIQPVM